MNTFFGVFNSWFSSVDAIMKPICPENVKENGILIVKIRIGKLEKKIESQVESFNGLTVKIAEAQ